jgi:lipopolysaccharide export system protein LptC
MAQREEPGVNRAAALVAPAAPRRALAAPWHARLIDQATAYLPLLLMVLLALGTWWLVKNTPLAEGEPPAAPPRHEPDYTMTNFTVQRLAPQGQLRVQIDGDRMRHYPDTDTLEIDNVRIRAIGADAGVTLATARQALSNGDGSEIQLRGGAHVVREASAKDEAIEFRGEFLHAFLNTERVRSHLPVTVVRGGSEIRAAAMEYDNVARVVELKGRMRAVFVPPGRPAASPLNR